MLRLFSLASLILWAVLFSKVRSVAIKVQERSINAPEATLDMRFLGATLVLADPAPPHAGPINL